MKRARADYGYTAAICGNCGKGNARTSSLKDHYQREYVKKDGRMVPNPCYKSRIQSQAKSPSEAKTILDTHSTMDKFFASKKQKN